MRGPTQSSDENRAGNPSEAGNGAHGGALGRIGLDTQLVPQLTKQSVDLEIAGEPSGPVHPEGNSPHRFSGNDTLLHVIWRQRGLIFVCTILCVISMAVYLRMATPLWTTEARLYVSRTGPNLIGEGATASTASENYLYTQCELIKSSPILALALSDSKSDRLSMFHDVHNRISFLKNALSVEVGKHDDIINVSMTSAYPDEATKIVNAVVDAYSDFQSKQGISTGGQMVEILAKEKEKCDAKIDVRTHDLADLRLAQNTVSLGGDGTSITMQRLSTLSAALTNAQLETLTAKSAFEQAARSEGFDTTRPNGADAISELDTASDAGDEEAIRAEVFRLRQQLDTYSHQYMSNHPAIQSLKAHIAELSRSIVLAAKQRYLAAQGREHELQTSFDAQQKLAVAQNASSFELTHLESELKRLQDQSDSLDKRIKELTLTEQAGALNITPVERATPSDGPTFPSRRKMLPIAALAGIALGIMLGLVREASGFRFNINPGSFLTLGGASTGSRTGASSKKKVRVFTSVARQGEVSIKHVAWSSHLRPESNIADSFRQVRDALEAAAASVAGLVAARTIAITSAINGEGRTITASNLAITLAKSGKRVCLVDADLRSPALARIYGLREDAGLSTVLSGQDALGKAIQRTVIERLDMLPAGPLPEDPPALLNVPLFLESLEDLTMKYDHVVIDSPAVLSAPDARIIAANCDATVMVMAQEGATRKVADQCRDGLTGVGAQVIGMIVNSVPKKAAARGRIDRAGGGSGGNSGGGSGGGSNSGRLIRKAPQQSDLPQLPHGPSRVAAEITQS